MKERRLMRSSRFGNGMVGFVNKNETSAATG
jgi:hypothetical protein